jgi:6-phosphogluconolactonase
MDRRQQRVGGGVRPERRVGIVIRTMSKSGAAPASGPQRYNFHDAQQLAARLAADVARDLRAGLAARGSAALIVSGGRSPIAFFQALSNAALDWARVTIGLADERWVDSASADSNERLVREHLLTGAARNAAFIPLKTDAVNPEAALAERTGALLAMTRPFDVVVLGMGEDGHIASLFPGAAGLAAALDPAAQPALVAAQAPAPRAANYPRISMNLAALLDTRRIALLIHGTAKRALLERAATEPSLRQLPVAALLHQSRVPLDVYWSA